MRIAPLVARAVVLNMVLASSVPFALAASGDTVIDDDNVANESVTEIDIDSASNTDVERTTQSGSTEEANAGVNGEAAVIIESDDSLDTHTDVDVAQECGSGTGNRVCYQDASPTVTNETTQNINASATNTINISQNGGSGAVQTAIATGTALVDITANQTVTTETVIDIFQDCSMHTGVCVQRALPEVLTKATQIIAANALNELNIDQTAGSGSVQKALADVVAQVNVNAGQVVSPRTFLNLTQICALDVGMCVQRALPVIQAAVEQVIDANADNVVGILQEAGENSSQSAGVISNSESNVTGSQTTGAQSTLEMLQRCGVKKGLCLHVDGSGNPSYIFSDGETTTAGDYYGTLDETPLLTEYSRRTVAMTAAGICGGSSTCSMLDQLLFWLFGPEPQPEQGGQTVNRDRTGGDTSHRGHGTNVLGATVSFVTGQKNDAELAPGAFGGAGNDGTISDTQKSVLCSLRMRLTAQNAAESAWDWTAEEVAAQIGITSKAAGALLHDPSVCPKEDTPDRPELRINFFPVTDDGPVSGNALWNDCIRGGHITLEEVRGNPDRTDDGLPRTCGAYHTGDVWYHPDLNIYFTWNRETGYLRLPYGYVPQAVGI